MYLVSTVRIVVVVDTKRVKNSATRWAGTRIILGPTSSLIYQNDRLFQDYKRRMRSCSLNETGKRYCSFKVSVHLRTYLMTTFVRPSITQVLVWRSNGDDSLELGWRWEMEGT